MFDGTDDNLEHQSLPPMRFDRFFAAGALINEWTGPVARRAQHQT